jgi:hypothetical protein
MNGSTLRMMNERRFEPELETVGCDDRFQGPGPRAQPNGVCTCGRDER